MAAPAAIAPPAAIPALPVIPAQAGIQKRRIAVLGAASTGKTTLATELASHLRERGLTAVAIPDLLPERRTREGRAPRPEECSAIAEDYERRIDAVCARADIVIDDTSALLLALGAGLSSQDSAASRFASERLRRYDATLLTGLDLAAPPDAPPRDAASREQVDALLRAQLQRAGVPYQVVYGQGPARLRAALEALAGVLPQWLRANDAHENAGGAGWVWNCEKCSDPACEHRLFTRLNRGA
jgi:nicotinamide riboside kinase